MLSSGSSVPWRTWWDAAAVGFAATAVGWLAMPPGREGLCCCRVPALGSTYKYSKLCTGRTRAASLGNARDALRWWEVLMAEFCNRYLQLAPAPAGHKGWAIKRTVPRCRSSLPPPL